MSRRWRINKQHTSRLLCCLLVDDNSETKYRFVTCSFARNQTNRQIMMMSQAGLAIASLHNHSTTIFFVSLSHNSQLSFAYNASAHQFSLSISLNYGYICLFTFGDGLPSSYVVNYIKRTNLKQTCITVSKVNNRKQRTCIANATLSSRFNLYWLLLFCLPNTILRLTTIKALEYFASLANFLA